MPHYWVQNCFFWVMYSVGHQQFVAIRYYRLKTTAFLTVNLSKENAQWMGRKRLIFLLSLFKTLARKAAGSTLSLK